MSRCLKHNKYTNIISCKWSAPGKKNNSRH